MPELDWGRKRMGNRVLSEWGVESNLDAAGEIFSCPLFALGTGKTGTCARPNHTRNQGILGGDKIVSEKTSARAIGVVWTSTWAEGK
jgi:hypothetical protein